MGNIDIFELLVIAALVYAAYLAMKAKDTVAAICLAAPALYLLVSAFETTAEFGSPDPTPPLTFALGNISVIELALVASAAYGAYRMWNVDKTASIVGFAAAAYVMYLSSTASAEL